MNQTEFERSTVERLLGEANESLIKRGLFLDILEMWNFILLYATLAIFIFMAYRFYQKKSNRILHRLLVACAYLQIPGLVLLFLTEDFFLTELWINGASFRVLRYSNFELITQSILYSIVLLTDVYTWLNPEMQQKLKEYCSPVISFIKKGYAWFKPRILNCYKHIKEYVKDIVIDPSDLDDESDDQ